jgi:hypothetical protein
LNHTTTVAIRIFIAAALSLSMLVAGTSLVTLQQHKGYAASQTKKEEQSTVQSLRGNFAKRSASQHIDQENQCLRTGKCNNSNVGEQTLGNDNSITGFADQSKNVQAVVTPPTPTPTPTLRLQNSGVLTIFKVCFPSCQGITFSITVTGNNPQPSSFTLSGGGHQAVTLGTGTFTVTEAHVAGFNPPSFANNCKQVTGDSATGTISAGQTLSCVITNIRR